jgi:ATP-binding cassette, subfamily B, bacterial
MNIENAPIPQKPLSFLWLTSKPYKLPMYLAIFAVIISAVVGALVPYLFKQIVDNINNVASLGAESVPFWALLYVLFTFTSVMAWRVSGFAGMRWATGVRATSQELLSRYVTKHSYRFFSDRLAGSIGNQLHNASEGVKGMVEEVLWNWIRFLFGLIISLGLAFYTNIYIGMILIIWLCVIVPLNIWLAKKKIPLSIAAQKANTELRAQIIDTFTNINAMYDYARRSFELERIKNLIHLRRKSGLKNWMFTDIVLTFNVILETIFIGGIIFMTIYLWNTSVITGGDIILVLALIVSIRNDIAHIGHRFNGFAETIGQIKEGLGEILQEHEIIDAPQALGLKVTNGEVNFENISFKYEERDIFLKLNLYIKAGQRIGLVGKSGVGKSTLMKLLMRQYDLSGGKILIDEQDISYVTQESLRDSIAVVPQDPLLFHRSLKDNIRYGKLSATDDEIRTAAKQAQAHQFIDATLHQYDTLVGERGIKLSGGERQRVAIARAFLKNAKILLLDEATSSLDSQSETLVKEALEELMKGKTVIAIAHRLSTLKAMDRIIVIDNGQIVEDGTHNELLKNKEIYHELWSHQVGGFLEDE